jgi:hypothetical protein
LLPGLVIWVSLKALRRTYISGRVNITQDSTGHVGYSKTMADLFAQFKAIGFRECEENK